MRSLISISETLGGEAAPVVRLLMIAESQPEIGGPAVMAASSSPPSWSSGSHEVSRPVVNDTQRKRRLEIRFLELRNKNLLLKNKKLKLQIKILEENTKDMQSLQ